MHLPTMRARRAVNRPLEALDAVGPRPREAAIEFLRGKIAAGQASLDTADEAVFVVDASRFERVWAAATFNLCGQLLTVTGHPRNDGWRLRGILEADVRFELGLDTVAAAPLSLVEVAADPTPPLMREPMRRAQHAAAVRADCGCGAPAGLECRCTDEQRLATTPERTVH